MQQYLASLCARPVAVCDHTEYTTLPGTNVRGGPLTDHEQWAAECNHCGQLILVTTFFGREEDRTEYRVMTPSEVDDTRSALSIYAAEEAACFVDRCDD